MIFKKNRFFLALLFALLAAFFCVTGVSADDETPVVPIDPPKVVGIKFITLPFKNLYLVGEKLDMSGAVLELTYDTGMTGTTPVKVDWTSGFSSSKEGERVVTVTYPDTKCKATFNVEVVSEKSLKIVPPKALTYFVGDPEDRGGLSVSVVYSNGKITELAPSSYSVKGFSTNTIGEKTITVTYKDLKASYKITVFEPALTRLEITKKPNKLSYYIGEPLDTTGMKVTAYYENGKSADVTSKVKVSGDVSSKGLKTVTVSYTENDHMKNATYQVSVIDVEIRNVVFATYPKKTAYLEGETFDPTGISVTVTYNNGKIETVSEGLLRYTGFDSETVGEKTVTLYYGDFQLDFKVTVSVSDSHVHKESEYKVTLPPTCTAEGVKSTTCTVCFEVVSTQTIAPNGHGDESMPIQIKAPTCTDAGMTATYCMLCGEAVTFSDIFPTGHTPGAVQFILAPTCTESGLSKTFCTVCGDEVNSSTINPYGHTFGVWMMKTVPTGEHEGREERVCSVCAAVESNIIPKLVHTLTSGDFSATLGSESAYFPYYSNFYGACVTDSLSVAEKNALTLTAEDGKIFEIIEVFDLAVSNSKGEEFVPTEGIIFTVNYSIPRGEYASFVVYGEDRSEVLYFAEGDTLSLVCEGNGRFVLAGEVIPEISENGGETVGENTAPDTDAEDIPVSGSEILRGNPIISVMIIIAIILIVVIAAGVYAYIFKRYY